MDHYLDAGRDSNSARTDGSWPQAWKDKSTLSHRRTFDGPRILGDYNMDGLVNALDDEVN